MRLSLSVLLLALVVAAPALAQEAAPSPKVDYNQMNLGSFGGCQRVTMMLEPVCEQDPTQTRTPRPATTKSRGRGADKRFETPKVDYNQMGRFGVYHGCQRITPMLEPVCEETFAEPLKPPPSAP